MPTAAAATTSGAAYTWGLDDWGQAGDPSLALRRVASPVGGGLPQVKSVVDTGIDEYELASNGGVWAQGYNADNEIGSGLDQYRAAPAPVPGLPAGVVQIAGNEGAGYARTTSGEVWAWGVLLLQGTGNTSIDGGPAVQSDVSHVVDLAAGGSGVLVALADGHVEEWGRDLGGDTASDNHYAPFWVRGLSGITGVATGLDTFFAWNKAGTLWAWGDNTYGALGLPQRKMISAPTVVPGIPPVASLATLGAQNYYSTIEPHTLELTTTGTVWSWGDDHDGQLGHGPFLVTGLPAPVAGLSAIRSVAAGSGFSLAADSTGAVWAWGTNSNGQLGDGSASLHLAPEKTARLTAVSEVAAGGWSAMAVAPTQTLPAPPGVLTFEGAFADNASQQPAGQFDVYLPGNEESGELAIADIYTACGEHAAPAKGWTTLGHADDNDPDQCGSEWIYAMTIPANEPRAQNFKIPDGKIYGGTIVDFYGQDRSDPIEGFAAAAQAMQIVEQNGEQIYEVNQPTVTDAVPFSVTIAEDTLELNSDISSGSDQLEYLYPSSPNATEMSVDAATVVGTGVSSGLPEFTGTTGVIGPPTVVTAQVLLRPAPALAVP